MNVGLMMFAFGGIAFCLGVVATMLALGMASSRTPCSEARFERRRMLALSVAECDQIADDYSKSMMPEHANGAYACAAAIRILMGDDGGRRIIVLAPDDDVSEAA